eukprot:Lithocolla_globosa_v1_NODE_540_length_3787_cov_70.867631.p2 type:complete len:227 gc:universal NODE_540_length_3787_cov_70.867631:338-1018(+)
MALIKNLAQLFLLYYSFPETYEKRRNQGLGILVIGYCFGRLYVEEYVKKKKTTMNLYAHDIWVNAWKDFQENGTLISGLLEKKEQLFAIIGEIMSSFTNYHDDFLLTVLTRVAGQRDFQLSHGGQRQHTTHNAIRKLAKQFPWQNFVVKAALLEGEDGEKLVSVMVGAGFQESVWWKRESNGDIAIFNVTGPVGECNEVKIARSYKEGIKTRQEEAELSEISDNRF